MHILANAMNPKDSGEKDLKKAFSDRLEWRVSCFNDLKYDELDNDHADDMAVRRGDHIICGQHPAQQLPLQTAKHPWRL